MKKLVKVHLVEDIKVYLVEDMKDHGRGSRSPNSIWFQTEKPREEDPIEILWSGQISRTLFDLLALSRGYLSKKGGKTK